jgi:hypothetical protein
MGRVTSAYAGLSEEQLARIEALAARLLEQSGAKGVVVTLVGGSAIAAAGDVSPGASIHTFSEKVAGRLRVHVRYDEETSLGLVRLRLRHFAEEMQRIVQVAQS